MFEILRIPALNKPLAFILMCSFMLTTNGCYYFRVAKSPDNSPEIIKTLQDKNKFIILHLEDEAWYLNNIVLNETSLEGNISELIGHEKFKTVKPYSSNRYKKKGSNNESNVTNEVHVFVSGMVNESGKISIPANAIKKIEIYDKDTGATIASWFFGILGVSIGAFAVLLIIVALTKSSCPFVYIHDGNDFIFTGEIFSGATQPGLERDDYLFLPGIKPSESVYKLKLTNEVHEIQSVNFTTLMVVDHPENLSVLFDKYGVLQTFKKPVSPLSATNRSRKNILDVIVSKDSLNYSGDINNNGKDGIEEVILKFSKPQNCKSAKLVIRAKNSFWLDVLFTRFHNLFGDQYDNFSHKQESVPGKQLNKFLLDQNLPLSVYIERDGKWQFVDYFNIAGPMAMRDDVLPVDFADIDSDTVKIKLETGFLFWEIDYTAMDFSQNELLKTTEISVNEAISNNESDVKDMIFSKDLKYLVLKNVGDEVNLSFKDQAIGNKEKSVFLHTSGYYKILREQDGSPDRKTLKTFRKPNRFPQFSREMYDLLSVK